MVGMRRSSPCKIRRHISYHCHSAFEKLVIRVHDTSIYSYEKVIVTMKFTSRGIVHPKIILQSDNCTLESHSILKSVAQTYIYPCPLLLSPFPQGLIQLVGIIITVYIIYCLQVNTSYFF